MRHAEKRQADLLHRLYADLTVDLGTDADVQALRWLTDHGHEHFVTELLDADMQCARLARDGADDDTFRAAVEAFVGKVRKMRGLYRERQGP